MKHFLLFAATFLSSLHLSTALRGGLSRSDLERLAQDIADDELWEDDTVLVARKISNLLDDTRRLEATTTSTTL
jgi:hypothetical protein